MLFRQRNRNQLRICRAGSGTWDEHITQVITQNNVLRITWESYLSLSHIYWWCGFLQPKLCRYVDIMNQLFKGHNHCRGRPPTKGACREGPKRIWPPGNVINHMIVQKNARDWVYATCTGEIWRKPCRHNHTSCSPQTTTSAKERSRWGMSFCEEKIQVVQPPPL